MGSSWNGMVVAVMGDSKTNDHLLYCPYETASYSQKIVCEGPVPGSAVHLRFNTHKQLLDYKNQYCRRRNCDKCPIAAVLNKKWYG